MRRSLMFVAVALLLVAGACASAPSGPLTYAVEVDAPSPEGKKLQVSAYFPGSITAAAGDSIEFSNKSTEAPHTITFGVLADRSNQPQLITAEGENPVAFGPCRTKDDPTPELNECESQELGAYDGTGYWNSGLLQSAPAPEQAGAKDITVELADDIPTGEYTFVCVLHPFMNGTVTIVEDEADREEPDDVSTQAREARDDALESGEALEAPEVERDGETVVVSAGWGDRVTAVNLFAPAEVEVDAGGTVRWVARSPYEPHTVTFGKTFQPGDPKAVIAEGAESGADYSEGVAHSGLLGPEGSPFPLKRYELTFPEAGEYEYSCALHPGQVGVVRVT